MHENLCECREIFITSAIMLSAHILWESRIILNMTNGTHDTISSRKLITWYLSSNGSSIIKPSLLIFVPFLYIYGINPFDGRSLSTHMIMFHSTEATVGKKREKYIKQTEQIVAYAFNADVTIKYQISLWMIQRILQLMWHSQWTMSSNFNWNFILIHSDEF